MVNDIWDNGQPVNVKGYSNIGYRGGIQGITMRYEWSPPNPEWYYFDSSGVKVYYTQRMLCFLMRIVECEDAPYGMTFPEVVETTVNVKNNNNITTKNVTLFNSDGEWTLPVREYFPVIIGAQDELNSPIRLNLVSLYGADFYDYGTVSILFEDSLLTEWIAAGENGYGFSRSGNRFTITDPILFEISEIPVEFGKIHQVLIDVKVDSLPLMDSVPFQFKLVQFSDSATEPDGGVYVEGIIPMKPPVIPVEKTIKQEDNSENPVNEPVNYAQNNEVKPEDESNQETKAHLTPSNQVIAYPNPFHKEVTFKIELAQETEVEIVVYNSLGAKVGNIPSQIQSEGIHQLKFNGAHLAPGIYHCTIKLGDDYHNIKLIISR